MVIENINCEAGVCKGMESGVLSGIQSEGEHKNNQMFKKVKMYRK